jgi:hypothetical protein
MILRSSYKPFHWKVTLASLILMCMRSMTCIVALAAPLYASITASCIRSRILLSALCSLRSRSLLARSSSSFQNLYFLEFVQLLLVTDTITSYILCVYTHLHRVHDCSLVTCSGLLALRE